MSHDGEVEWMLQLLTSEDSIFRSDVEAWMKSSDVEVLGIVYHLLSDPQKWRRISPPLADEMVFTFCKEYLLKCLREDPSTEWAHDSFAAGHDFAAWFRHAWHDSRSSRDKFDELKLALTRLYISVDDSTKLALTQACFEHLFEDPDIAHFFRDWEDDPALKHTYLEAIEWGKTFW